MTGNCRSFLRKLTEIWKDDRKFEEFFRFCLIKAHEISSINRGVRPKYLAQWPVGIIVRDQRNHDPPLHSLQLMEPQPVLPKGHIHVTEQRLLNVHWNELH